MMRMSIPGRLFLVRHGETDWNREGRLQGSQDIPLNALGRMQAAEVADRLRALKPEFATSAYVASPMHRARATPPWLTITVSGAIVSSEGRIRSASMR